MIFEKRADIDINKENIEGSTAISIALNKRNLQIIKNLLLITTINLDIPDNKSNYRLLSLPFDDLGMTLKLLEMIYHIKNKINCFVFNSETKENLLLKAIKIWAGLESDPKKKLLQKKIIAIILKMGFAKNITGLAMNRQGKDSQTAIDIACSNRTLFSIAKKLLFAGWNGKHSQFARRKRLLLVIYLMMTRMINIPNIKRKEKRYDILDEMNL